MGFFAQRPKRVYSGDQLMSMSAGVTKTGETPELTHVVENFDLFSFKTRPSRPVVT